MPKYRDIPMQERIDKIGELLAKGVYLYVQKQKEAAEENKVDERNNIAEAEKSC